MIHHFQANYHKPSDESKSIFQYSLCLTLTQKQKEIVEIIKENIRKIFRKKRSPRLFDKEKCHLSNAGRIGESSEFRLL